MPKKRAKLSVMVGKPWPDKLEVVEVSIPEKIDNLRGRVVCALIVGAGVVVAIFAAFALIRGDPVLQDRVFNLAERVLLVAAGWLGHSIKGK